MNRCDLFICERAPRWAPALRLALERKHSIAAGHLRLREVRRLDELNIALRQRPASLAAIEVGMGTFMEVLDWLMMARVTFPHAHFATFIDSSIAADRRREVCAVLHEAGSAVTASSPRQLGRVLEVISLHVECTPTFDDLAVDSSLESRARASLPWQDG